jgi:SAM-dependent methyltransferase
MAVSIDEARLEEYVGQIVGFMTGSVVCSAIWLGDELGLYRSLARTGATTSDALATDTGCHPRLVREWLDGQAAAGLIAYDAGSDTYELSAEGSLALADDTSPAFVARAMNATGAFYNDMDKVVSAFRSDGALSWADHHPCLFKGTEWFFRTGYRAHLTTEWIPALDGVAAKLEQGGTVADIGCGHGASAVVMAEAFPKATIVGFDFHAPSIDAAKAAAAEAGVSGNTRFEVQEAKSYQGTYDLICFFDCLHDMGDPVGIARYAREHLNPGGTILLVEPFALDGRVKNMAENPLAALLYGASTVICTPNSLSQDVGLGLGAQAGPERLGKVFEEAGYSSFRVATETPLNMIIEAKA